MRNINVDIDGGDFCFIVFCICLALVGIFGIVHDSSNDKTCTKDQTIMVQPESK